MLPSFAKLSIQSIQSSQLSQSCQPCRAPDAPDTATPLSDAARQTLEQTTKLEEDLQALGEGAEQARQQLLPQLFEQKQLFKRNLDEMECNICLGLIGDAPPTYEGLPETPYLSHVSQSCINRHYFHTACLQNLWRASHAMAKCPDCRADLRPELVAMFREPNKRPRDYNDSANSADAAQDRPPSAWKQAKQEREQFVFSDASRLEMQQKTSRVLDLMLNVRYEHSSLWNTLPGVQEGFWTQISAQVLNCESILDKLVKDFRRSPFPVNKFVSDLSGLMEIVKRLLLALLQQLRAIDSESDSVVEQDTLAFLKDVYAAQQAASELFVELSQPGGFYGAFATDKWGWRPMYRNLEYESVTRTLRLSAADVDVRLGRLRPPPPSAWQRIATFLSNRIPGR